MFRDDAAAALARESALERELSEVRRELGEERARVASLEERLFDQAQPRVVFAAAPPSMVGVPRWARWCHRLAVGLFVTGFVVIFPLFIWASFVRSRSHDVPGPVCTLRTEPSGASVFSTRAEGEVLLGTTPLGMEATRWLVAEQDHGVLVARKPGYDEVRVWSPIAGDECTDHLFRMSASR